LKSKKVTDSVQPTTEEGLEYSLEQIGGKNLVDLLENLKTDKQNAKAEVEKSYAVRTTDEKNQLIKFKISSSDEKMGELGVGISEYFKALASLGYVSLFLVAMSSLLMFINVCVGLNINNPENTNGLEKASLFTIGEMVTAEKSGVYSEVSSNQFNFLIGINAIDDLQLDRRIINLILAALDVVGIMCFLIYWKKFGSKLNDRVKEADLSVITISDYCMHVTGLPSKLRSPDALKNHFDDLGLPCADILLIRDIGKIMNGQNRRAHLTMNAIIAKEDLSKKGQTTSKLLQLLMKVRTAVDSNLLKQWREGFCTYGAMIIFETEEAYLQCDKIYGGTGILIIHSYNTFL